MKLTDLSCTLGLSVSTVSRALRNAEGVDTQTRTRVLAEAARAGYRGPGRQRLVRSGKTRTILALSRNDTRSVSYDALAGMSQAAIEFNVSIVTHQTPHEAPESILNPKWQPPAMRTGQVDGIVLLNEWPDPVVAELQLGHPVVSMLYDYPECDVVGLDELEAMRALVAHLEAVRSGPLGYFGFCHGPTLYNRLHDAFKTVRGRTREEPVVKVPRQIDPEKREAAHCGELFDHIKNGVHSWICPDGPSAELLINNARFCGDDDIRNLLVGVFYPSGRHSANETRWTSLDFPGEELGIAAVRRLLHRIEHPSESIRRIAFKAALAPGDTTSPQTIR